MSLEYMYNEIIKRASQKLDNLAGLCADILLDKFTTFEINEVNDYYGHAETIKKFLGLPSYYSIKADISHGFLHPYYEVWEKEFNHKTPYTLVWGDGIKERFKHLTSKEIFSIGAPIFYSQSFLSAEEILTEKKD